ncbi:MAG TPA: PAS domain S-box protein [Syntrophorhabdaceae bacterium]|nr:PAS domain S-box protein [Syntrophorhabdaceae bacterium]
MENKPKIKQRSARIPGGIKNDPSPLRAGSPKPAADTCRIGLANLFDLSEIQALQDSFAEAMGVATVITDNAGNAVTRPAGFSERLNSIPRLDGLTFINCMYPSIVGPQVINENPRIEQCSGCGLLYGSVAINAGNERIANWIVGQVVDEGADMETILGATVKMGIDREEYRRALEGIPRVTRKRFEKICVTASLIAEQLSHLAIENIRKTQNIAELERVEEELRLSELRYRQMFSSNPFPCILYDLETLGILDVNDAAADHYGYSRKELLSMTLKEILLPEELPRLLEYLADPAAHAPGETWRHRKKDGTVTIVEVTGHTIDFPGKKHRIINVIDITEQKRTHERLQFTQSAVDHALDCIFWLDRDARIVFANDAASRITGYSPEELSSMTILDIDPDFTMEKWLEHWEKKREAGAMVFETHHRTRSGRIYPVEVSASYFVYDNKEYNCSFARDISERKKAEEKLLFTQFAVDRAAALILWVDKDARILYANDEACRCLGYTSEEFLSLTISDIDPNFPKAVWNNHWESVKRKGTTLFESVQKRKDGSDCPVEINGNYMEFNGVGYICSICFDITQRKKTDELLKMTRFSVDQSSIPTFWLSTSGNAIHVNNAACYSLGYTKEEILGMNVKAWDEDFPYHRWDELGKLLKEQHSIIMESMHKRKDGSKFPVELNLNYMEYSGNEYIFAFAHNISERKRADEEKERLQMQLLQSQKMEAIGQLAGGVAHDFNNILTALIGYGNLLEMEMPEDDPLREYVEQILYSSEKAANLTQSLLAFSRKQAITLRHHNINDIISGVEKLLKRLLSEDIDLKISPALQNIVVLADITQINQVLINLATNARDAMPAGGTLSIEARCINLDGSGFDVRGNGKTSRYVMISVSDSGVGIDAATREHIFEPFFTTKEVGKGTGLGLSIVYGIIKQHNGFITVYSEPRGGTTFHIYLPTVDGKAEKEKKETPVIRDASGTILIAEDNPDVRRLASNVLKRTGYSVIEACDGQEAIDSFIANRESIDLIIVDVVMPKLNGKEVFEAIKAIKPDVKTIFTSGYTRDVVLEKGLRDKDVSFLSKPLSPHDLLQKIRELMSLARNE